MSSVHLLSEIVDHIDCIRSLRHDLHRHPELRFEESRTADLIVTTLTQWQIPNHRGLGKTGVVGIISAGNSDRAIGLRADMDALPIQENNQFVHASSYSGKMHACGHDGHVAMLLAAAHCLTKRQQFNGTVYLIFQPAEEEGAGAKQMIQDGLFQRFPMDSVYGMHNWPGLEAGQFAISPGPVMASSNSFHLVIRGKGCHAALPHLGLDPIPVAAQIITAFQTILTRNLNPLDNGLLSVTQIHGGDTTNVIADYCELAGTVRTFSNTVLDQIENRMRELAVHICSAHGMQCDFAFHRHYPTTVNHAEPAAISRQVMLSIVGEQQVIAQQPTMGAEDFSFMLEAVPGCYCFIGNGAGEHRANGHGTGPCTLHNASYDFNDEILALGATYWVKLVETCLPL